MEDNAIARKIGHLKYVERADRNKMAGSEYWSAELC